MLGFIKIIILKLQFNLFTMESLKNIIYTYVAQLVIIIGINN